MLSVLRVQGGPGALKQKGGAWGERPGDPGRRKRGGGLQARQCHPHKPRALRQHHLQQERADASAAAGAQRVRQLQGS